jgi:dTDP-4-amino-4,6-dideoxygalactose transaminase
MTTGTNFDLPIRSHRPVRETFLVFGKPCIEEPEIDEVVHTLRSGWLGTGPKVHEFERRFARYTTAQHAIALNSCTAGLHLALTVLGIGPGDEVITAPMTFAATANVILHCGATPVFADVGQHKLTIDPAAVEQAITPRTKALLPVHFGGRACDLDALRSLADRHGLYIIEDAAHAIETLYRGRKVGAIGDITCFSFYVTKSIVTGEGGMVTTNNPAWAERLRILSLHGLSQDAWSRFSGKACQHYEVLEPGYKYNMMDLQAALGLHQMARLEANYERRREIWNRYDEAFRDLPVFPLTPESEAGSRHALHLYTLLLDLQHLTEDRDFVRQALHQENIGTGIHYKALHLHPYYAGRFGLTRGMFPNAEWVSDRTLSLPLSAHMTDEDVDDVTFAVRKVLRSIQR